ncbi:hypothetical protein VSR01_01330 [Actinacidiphila sp. DG2A-62]|uniref:hypothetical protein n=1 Tax=Actinacidiphila sp. DG2A-62 TaxID=3108821 RepID=UPI002DBE184B|nr:hypothetical protein [Actinacidiphila sp. DG2A-62]MEC3992258.1 hypothetical protein [Actinacidiphila sp. DG2A-62]
MSPLAGRRLADRLAAVEKIRDSRRMMHTVRLADGRTARVSLLDMLIMLNDGLALDYSARHDTEAAEQAEAPEPPQVARVVAAADPSSNPSVMFDLMRWVAREWCDAYDEHRPFALNDQEPAPC